MWSGIWSTVFLNAWMTVTGGSAPGPDSVIRSLTTPSRTQVLSSSGSSTFSDATHGHDPVVRWKLLRRNWKLLCSINTSVTDCNFFYIFICTLHFYLYVAGRLFAVSCYCLLLLLLFKNIKRYNIGELQLLLLLRGWLWTCKYVTVF